MTQDLESSQFIKKEEWEEAILRARSLVILGNGKIEKAMNSLEQLVLYNNGSNIYVTNHIQDLKGTLNSLAEFQNNKYKVKNDGCNAPKMTIGDVIKCSSSTDDEKNIAKVIDLIDQALENSNFRKIFSVLAIFIAQSSGRDSYIFQFSDKLEPYSTPSYLNTNFTLSILVHEAYHSLQYTLLKGDEFYDTEDNFFKDAYFKALESTYKNIIDLVTPHQGMESIEDLLELEAIIREAVPDIKKFDMCNPDIIRLVQNRYTFNNTISDLKFNLPEEDYAYYFEEVDNIEQFFDKNEINCKTLINKYNYSQEQINLLGRFEYFLSCQDFDLENKIIPSANCKSLSTELVPSIFQLVAGGISKDTTAVVQPMLDYLDIYVEAFINYFKDKHTHDYCDIFVAEINQQSLLGACVIDL